MIFFMKNNPSIANILSFTLSKVYRTKFFLGALKELLFEKYKLMHFNEHFNIFSIHCLGLGLGCNYTIIPGWTGLGSSAKMRAHKLLFTRGQNFQTATAVDYCRRLLTRSYVSTHL